ncbi:MAG: C-terminal binding protein [Oscillospiraceae bacterium]|nr:C-terminal binding protein [Oscillospiraceae bacterium]
MAKYKVVITDEWSESYDIEREVLRRVDAELVVCRTRSEDEVIAACRDADGLLVPLTDINAQVVAGLERCRVVSRYGVGYDNVDVDACTKRGIWVSNVPGYCADDVAEHALALLFSCLRKTALRDRLIRQGSWNLSAAGSFRLAGKTVGLIGGGGIARALMKKMGGFDVRLLVYSPHVPQEMLDEYGARKVSLEELLRESDVVSLHVPANDKNRGIINAETLALMKPGAILINTARGALVDDAALIAALQSGTIAFAGLDTHNFEPLPKDSPYFGLDNVVLTDHTAYNTPEAVKELKRRAAENVAAVLEGKAPNTPVNHIE